MRRHNYLRRTRQAHIAGINRSLVVLLIAGFGAGCASNAQPSPPAVVEMTNTLKFEPDTLRIKVGTIVEWRNTSLLTHTVTADPELATIEGSASLPDGADPFDSGNLDPEANFSYEFSAPGSYGYFCIPHEGAKMRGVVIVE